MYARITSGGYKAGLILGLHRYYHAADRKSAACFEVVLNMGNTKVRVGDYVTDWIARYEASKAALRRGNVFANSTYNKHRL